jgi:hypothetical protein
MIRTKPASKEYRANYDSVFKRSKAYKNHDRHMDKIFTDAYKPLGEQADSFQKVYVNNDPHFGG